MINLSTKIVTARKAHHCHGCYHDIPKGDTYERQGNVYDGRSYTFRMCRCCLSFVREYDADVKKYNEARSHNAMRALTFYDEYEELHEGQMPDVDGYPEFARAFWAGEADK